MTKVEVEPVGRDLNKEAQEGATAALQRAAATAGAAEAAAEQTKQSLEAAAQIAASATSTTGLGSDYNPVKMLSIFGQRRHTEPLPQTTAPPRSLSSMEAAEQRGTPIPNIFDPAWREWEKFERLQQEMQIRTNELDRQPSELEGKTQNKTRVDARFGSKDDSTNRSRTKTERTRDSGQDL